jgi:branched-chain amino acid transport system permease protein
MLTIVVDGLAYGMLLFILAAGLSVTLGLMNFINLAHGAFAMAGGYLLVVLMQRYDMPFLACLPLTFAVPALAGLILERTLYVQMYSRSHLDQVLFSMGLVFITVAGMSYAMGTQEQIVKLPEWLQGRIDVYGVALGRYRLFIAGVCAVLVIGLEVIFASTRFGSRLRAAVDDQRVARGLGIPVPAIFAATFAVGSGLAGLGGALGAELMGLDPGFPLKFMIYFLIVVTVGGTTGLKGPFFASLILGVADVAGKYYFPALGAFVIYLLMIVILTVRPNGLFVRGR